MARADSWGVRGALTSSEVRDQRSEIRDQRSDFSLSPSTIHHPPSTIHHSPSIIQRPFVSIAPSPPLPLRPTTPKPHPGFRAKSYSYLRLIHLQRLFPFHPIRAKRAAKKPDNTYMLSTPHPFPPPVPLPSNQSKIRGQKAREVIYVIYASSISTASSSPTQSDQNRILDFPPSLIAIYASSMSTASSSSIPFASDTPFTALSLPCSHL